MVKATCRTSVSDREEGKRVWGLGCKVQGLRHRAEDSIRVQGVGIMVQLLCVC